MRRGETRHQMIVRRFMSGESMGELAKKLGVKLETIENHIRQANRPQPLKRGAIEAGRVTVSILQQALVQFEPDAPVLVFDEDGVCLEIDDIGPSGCDEPTAAAIHVVELEDDDDGSGPEAPAPKLEETRTKTTLLSLADRALHSARDVFPAWKQMS